MCTVNKFMARCPFCRSLTEIREENEPLCKEALSNVQPEQGACQSGIRIKASVNQPKSCKICEECENALIKSLSRLSGLEEVWPSTEIDK